MVFEKATIQDINVLTDLRIAYLQEDLGTITDEDIISCAFLLIVEKPMSPSFITGKTGIILNVYTKPEWRKKGYAKKLMTMLLEDATVQGVSVIELKATEDGYSLYKSVGFEDVVTKYHNMKIVLK